MRRKLPTLKGEERATKQDGLRGGQRCTGTSVVPAAHFVRSTIVMSLYHASLGGPPWI